MIIKTCGRCVHFSLRLTLPLSGACRAPFPPLPRWFLDSIEQSGSPELEASDLMAADCECYQEKENHDNS